MLKSITYHLMLIRITLYKQFHNPAIMLSLILITSLCITVLQLSSQLVVQIMHAPLSIANAEKSYQLHIQQGPLATDGFTMLYPETLYEIKQWALPINVITKKTETVQWLADKGEQYSITRSVISDNYLGQFNIKIQLGSIKNFDSQSVIIDNDFWRHNLFSDPNVIGTYINISGERYQISAVLNADASVVGSTEQVLGSNNRPGIIYIKETQVTFVREGENTLLLNPDIFLQSGLNITQLENTVSTWVNEYNAVAPRAKQLSFSIDNLRKVMYGSWYYLAPSLLMASFLILCIGLTAMGSLCLAHAGKTQRDVVLSYVLGANKYAIRLMEAWVALTISFTSNAIAYTLCTMINKYLQSLGFVKWSLAPSISIIACSIMVIWSCIFLLLILPHKTIDIMNLNSGLASSGKGHSGMFNLNMMKKIINIQVFSIGVFLLLGVSYLISNIIKLSLLLASSYQNVAYVQIEKFHDKAQSQASQAAVVAEIKQQLSSHPNISEIGMLGADPLALSFSLIMCKMPNHSTIISKGYVTPNIFSILKAKTLAGSIPLNQTQQQVVISKEAALKLFGSTSNVIGEKLPCRGTSGEKQVAAIVDLNRFIPKEIESFIDQSQPMIFQAFDWKLMDSKGADKATFVFKYNRNLPATLLNNIRKKQKNTLRLSPIMVVEDQLKIKGREMRLSISLSSLITLATIIVACFSLYGGLKYQTMLREHQLAVFKCLGMPNAKLILFVAKDNIVGTSISLLLALILTALLDFVFGENAITLFSIGLTISGVTIIYLCASVGPSVQLMNKKNMRELLY